MPSRKDGKPRLSKTNRFGSLPVEGRFYTNGKCDAKTKHYYYADIPDIPTGKNSIQVTVWLAADETASNPVEPRYAYQGPGKVVYVLNSTGELTAEFFPQKV